jgi:hypothetical protein
VNGEECWGRMGGVGHGRAMIWWEWWMAWWESGGRYGHTEWEEGRRRKKERCRTAGKAKEIGGSRARFELLMTKIGRLVFVPGKKK